MVPEDNLAIRPYRDAKENCGKVYKARVKHMNNISFQPQSYEEIIWFEALLPHNTKKKTLKKPGSAVFLLS